MLALDRTYSREPVNRITRVFNLESTKQKNIIMKPKNA